VLIAIASVWFAISLTTIIWAWGLNPMVVPTSDEAVIRYAAWLIEHGRGPFLDVPLPDPEDLMHPRSWLTIDNRATPTYAPVSFYLYGWILRLHEFGQFLIAAMPASGVALFAAGCARLLPVRRRWLALLAPLVGFPALYWLMRPWINMSPFLTSLCWTVFCWASWRESNKDGWLVAALGCLGYGAAMRPDYAAYLFVLTLLFGIAARPDRWKLIFALVIASGVLALTPNLILNKMITGHALKAAYQMSIDRLFGAEPEHTIPGLGMLRSLVLPMGIPSWEVGSTAFRKYWLTMGPVALLLFGQLALVPLLAKPPPKARYLLALAVAIMAFFCLSRMHDDLWGGSMKVGGVYHSVPRYLTPVYLLAALPPLLFLGQCKNRWLMIGGCLLASALAVGGGYEIWSHKPNSSFNFVRDFNTKKTAELGRLLKVLPEDAAVYTPREDIWTWPQGRIWTIDDPGPTAQSVERASKALNNVYLLIPSQTPQVKRLIVELARRRISLQKIGAIRGLHKVQRAPTE